MSILKCTWRPVATPGDVAAPVGRIKFWSVVGIAAALVSLPVEGADRRFEDLTDRERMERRGAPGSAGQRRAMAIAERRVGERTGGDVIDGARDPELLMAWEIMDHLSGAFMSDEAKLASLVDRWRQRGAAEYLGEDFVSRLRAIAGPYFDADAEFRRVSLKRASADPAEAEVLRARPSEINDSLCRLRSDALSEGRRRVGHARFQRFLYQVVAPDVVIISTPVPSPEAGLELGQWVDEGCR